MYEIIIKKGRKIIERHTKDDYEEAMRLLDHLIETCSDRYTVEFKNKKLVVDKRI